MPNLKKNKCKNYKNDEKVKSSVEFVQSAFIISNEKLNSL